MSATSKAIKVKIIPSNYFPGWSRKASSIFGARTVRFPAGTVSINIWRFAGVTVTSLQVEIVFIAVLLMVALTSFLNRTRIGKAIRAVAENERTARLLGIHVDVVIAWTFFISSALGGPAGILFGLYFDSLSPDMGRSIELKGPAVIRTYLGQMV